MSSLGTWARKFSSPNTNHQQEVHFSCAHLGVEGGTHDVHFLGCNAVRFLQLVLQSTEVQRLQWGTGAASYWHRTFQHLHTKKGKKLQTAQIMTQMTLIWISKQVTKQKQTDTKQKLK